MIENDKKKKIINISFLSLLVLLIVGITSFYIGKNQSEQANSPIPVLDASKITGTRVAGIQTYDWQGIITKVDDSSLVFTTELSQTDGTTSTKEITAFLTKNIQLSALDLTTSPAPDKISSQQKNITLSELRPGQQVIIRSSDNINSRNEINADSVNVLITPN